ncbi:unnamed protein product [Symbiodinium sp. CCMP2592]|nr:unnamed protein product [Symbiodinium sp. CCMP2592]
MGINGTSVHAVLLAQADLTWFGLALIFVEHLVDLLGTYAADRDLYLARDGSSKDGVGSSGVAIQHPDTVAACGDGLEDQTPYRLLLPGLWCNAAIRAIQSNSGFDYALLLDTIRGYLKKLHDGQLEVMFIWTPSRDKKLGWTPPLGLSAARLRALNEAADKAAAASMGQRCLCTLFGVGVAEHLVELLGTFADEQDLFVATDGSSKDGVGSSGIAVQHPDSVAAFGDGLEDQSPYRMEVLALALALEAIDIARRAPKVRWRRVYLVVDCQAAIRAIQGEQGFDYALLLDTIRRYIKKFRDGKLEVEFVWTPSHGKQPTWAPHGGLCATQLRALNEAADKAAQASMERRWTGSHRRAYAQRARHAQQWETQALKAIATIAKAYRDYLHTLGTPSGEVAYVADFTAEEKEEFEEVCKVCFCKFARGNGKSGAAQNTPLSASATVSAEPRLGHEGTGNDNGPIA